MSFAWITNGKMKSLFLKKEYVLQFQKKKMIIKKLKKSIFDCKYQIILIIYLIIEVIFDGGIKEYTLVQILTGISFP